jgi:hypothetical protein
VQSLEETEAEDVILIAPAKLQVVALSTVGERTTLAYKEKS